MNLRILAALAEDEVRPEKEGDFPTPAASYPHLFKSWCHRMARRSRIALTHLPQRWVCMSEARPEEGVSYEALSLLDAHSMRRVGYAEIGLPDGRRLEFWRRDALIGLAESALLESPHDVMALSRLEAFLLRTSAFRSSGIAHDRGQDAAWRRSSRAMAPSCMAGASIFSRMRPINTTGRDSNRSSLGRARICKDREGNSNGRRCIFIGESAAELRRFFLENDVSLVHAISGVGFPVAEALNVHEHSASSTACTSGTRCLVIRSRPATSTR